MVMPIQDARRGARGAVPMRPEAIDGETHSTSLQGSIREVRLLGGGGAAGAGPIRRTGGVVEWAGRAYRVASHQGEPSYLHLEPIPMPDPAI